MVSPSCPNEISRGRGGRCAEKPRQPAPVTEFRLVSKSVRLLISFPLTDTCEFAGFRVMLDKNFVRENLEYVRERLLARGGSYPLEDLVRVDEERKSVLIRSEELRRQRNEASEEIGKLRRQGLETAQQQARVKEISNEIKALEDQVRILKEKLNAILHVIPNLPHESVPKGSDETANVEVRRWGEPPQFSFNPLDHVDLGSALGILDMDRATRIAGARFALLSGMGARLERAL